MTADPSPPPAAPKESLAHRPRLWNPNAACLWSLLFTPVFGALVQAKNWRAMGEPVRARVSSLWAWGTALYLLAANFGVIDIPRSAGLLLLVAWYLSSGYSQIKFVAKKYGAEYEKKSWLLPLAIAFAIWGLLLALALAALFLTGEVPLD